MNEQLSRIMQASHCRTQAELAEFLGVRQALISDAVRRGRVPRGWCETVQRKKGISVEWLLTGQGNLFAGQRNGAADRPGTVRYCLEVCPARALAKELAQALERCPCLCEGPVSLEKGVPVLSPRAWGERQGGLFSSAAEVPPEEGKR